jgi:type III secretion protein R
VTDLPDPVTLAIMFGAMALVPFMVVMVTAFTKIVVVLQLVRNALGIQQTPPNMVLFGLAIILTIYISMPVINDIAYPFSSGRSTSGRRRAGG